MQIPTRGRFVQPDIVTSHFHLREGDRVGDFGAGTGYFSAALSHAVGKNGRVYACEIQKPLVEKIGQSARERGLHNVEPIWADLEAEHGTRLADGLLDVGVMANVFFQFENKEAALREIARTIRKGGKFFVIEWSESFGGIGPHPEQVVDESRAKDLVRKAGFEYERTFPAGDHHYGLAFRRI